MGARWHMSLVSGGTLRYSSPGYIAARCWARTGFGGAHTGTEGDPTYNRRPWLFRLMCVVPAPHCSPPKMPCWLSGKDACGGVRGDRTCGGLAALVGLGGAGMFWLQGWLYQRIPDE